MAESEFYTQCEVEGLVSCQSNLNDVNLTAIPNSEHNGNAAASPASEGTAVVLSVPFALTPAIKTAVLGVPQTAASGGIAVEPAHVSSQPVPEVAWKIGTVGYVLHTGQAVINLTSTQADQLVTPQTTGLSDTLYAAAPGKSAVVQIPVPLICSSSIHENAAQMPQFCSHCGAAYKAVQTLRGYLCQCNPELTKSVHALTARSQKKKSKHGSEPVRYKPYSHKGNISPSSSFTSESSTHATGLPSLHSSLKHVTTSAIPEGSPVPGSGDYDKHGKLIMLVEDFYYGRDPGQYVLAKTKQEPVTMKCKLCNKSLKSNIKLMNHMRHHMEMEYQSNDMDCHTMCQHCFRNFDSPFSLQCHVETVHSQVEYPSLCKICELSFEDTPIFLNHMKNYHKPGEMPYICQVCNFRSSFYQDVIVHFREAHKDTILLLCPYCLKVFKSSNRYQLHYRKHQKKSVVYCNKCRLQFLCAKDKAEHKCEYHQTHLKPVQLLGLKPGTKVTIRAYAVTKVDVQTSCNKPSMDGENSPEKELPPAPELSGPTPSTHAPISGVQRITPPQRKPVESMLELMTKFQSQYEQTRKYLCIECNFQIPDFSSHFPTFVHCSLCHYSTCCSRAYANHMISNHVPRKTTTKYLNLYKSCPTFGKLSCYSCDYTTEVGDSMAKHLVKHPDHKVNLCKLQDGFCSGYKRFVFIPTDLIRSNQRISSGIIMPVQVTQTSVHQPTELVPLPPEPLPQPNHLLNHHVSFIHNPSIPTEVQSVDQSTVPIENYGTEPRDTTPQDKELSSEMDIRAELPVGGSLTLTQLKMVLCALCFGIPQAANQFDTQPDEIHSLLLKRQLQLGPPKDEDEIISWEVDRLHEWVLCQREQQLPIAETKLFSKASEFMSTDRSSGISYDWAVDFLIKHNLSLPPMATSPRLLPQNAQECLLYFCQFINKQVTSQGFGLSTIGAMDELSIFVDMEQLDPASADSASMLSAFKVVGEMDLVMDVVLAALADGTMLPTMVFLRGEPLSTDAPALPENIIIEAKPEGFSDEERLQLWFNTVWCQHVKPSSGGKGLLIMDSYRGHLADNFLALLNSANTMPSIIPHACSCRLQPLEACVGVVLRELLQDRWSQHVTESPQDLIGAEPADLALLFSAWLLEMLDVLVAKPELLKCSFAQVLSSNLELSPAEFSALVHNLTEALADDPLHEQVS